MSKHFKVLVSGVILSMLVAACSDKSGEQHIARAQQYIAKSEYQAAVIELKNALRKDSGNAQARWLLGELYSELGDPPSAEKELTRARDKGWPDNELLPLLARMIYLQGRHAEVMALDDSDLDPLAAGRLSAIKALSMEAQGNLDQAESLIDLAEKMAGDDIDVMLASAKIQASREELSAGLGTLEKILSASPEYGPAWSLRGDLLLKQGDLEAARVAYENAIKYNPNNSVERFKLALIDVQTGRLDDAEKAARKLLNSNPRHPGGNYVLGLIYFQSKDYADAIAALSIAEPMGEDFPPVLYYLGSSHLLQGSRDQAETAARKFHNLVPDNAAGRKLLAIVLLQNKRSREVQDLLQPVLEQYPEDIESMNLMAAALQQEGKQEESIAFLSRIAKLQPDSAEAKIRLGAGLLLHGQNEAAESQIQSAIELDPGLQQAEVMLILNHLQNKRYDDAIISADSYRKRNPSEITPHNLLGIAYLESGRDDEARSEFEIALSLSPGDSLANHQLAQMAEKRGDLETARAHYEAVLAEDDESLSALIQLARIDSTENNQKAMVEQLERAIEKNPEALEPRILLARHYLESGRPDQVEMVFATLSDSQKSSSPILHLQAIAQLATEEHGEASQTLQQLSELSTPTVDQLYLMALAANGKNESAQAKQYLEQALELDEDHLKSRLMLANMTIATGPEEDVQKHIDKLTAMAPESPEVILLRANLAHLQGDSETAISLLEQAFEISQTTGSMLAFTSYQIANGNTESALRTRQKWVEQHPDDLRARAALAETLYSTESLEQAQAEYEKVLEMDPSNMVSLNNLAWQLRITQPAKALIYAKRAHELAPESPDVLDTLAVVEYHNNDLQRARRTISQALDMAPDNPTLLYHRAMIDAALKNNDSAIETLDKLMQFGGSTTVFPEYEQAAELLKKLM